MQKIKPDDNALEFNDSSSKQAEIQAPQEGSKKKFSRTMEAALQAVEKMKKDNLH